VLTLGLVLALGVRAPERLTAGPADQYLGALGPDGRTLYFVSNEESTAQIYAQDIERGIPRLLFDEVADTSWPRPSPDGRHLLYISYRTDAKGDVCVRDLDAAGAAGPRRCLTDDKTADVQAIWMPDGGSIAVVMRAGLHDDFELRRVGLDGARGDVLVPGNLTSPAISPDGRWLAYVPVARGANDIGPSFLAHAGGALELFRLGAGAGPVRVALDLPGVSGFPAFSADGKWLYFTQFLNDTNLDTSVDGKDNGVLFRAPFADGRVGAPEQLTSARASCQYPVPARDRLVATCLEAGTLDVYTLPLEGGVPPDWTAARIDDELSASRDRWEQLLLLARRGGDAAVLRQMIRLHLELGEYESALFYAGRLQRVDAVAGTVLAELAAQRKAERELARGELSERFVREARARLERLAAMTGPLALVVASEIHDTLGEEQPARAALEHLPTPARSAALDHLPTAARSAAHDHLPTEDPFVAALYAERLLALYRDDPRYFVLYQPLAERELEHAQAFVRELVRGADAAERARRTEAWLKKVDPDSDLAFLLALERALADLTPATQEPVRASVFELYRKNKEWARRKALVGETVNRAIAEDNEYLLYNFANTWVSFVPRERAERRHAERMFRDAVLERAYVEEARGDVSAARGHFYGVTLQTDSLEAHAGTIEMRVAEHKDPSADYAQLKASDVVQRYARAYMLARGLPGEHDPARHEQAAQQALAELEAIALVAPQRDEVHALWGYVATQRWLRTGDRLAAVEANAHLLLALDLARGRPRHRAAILDALARVQASVGNHAIALGWLEERAKLPFTGDLPRLAHCLALARARFHSEAVSAAVTAIDECVDQAQHGLDRFRPLVLDRSGLYHLVAGDPAGAALRYGVLWPLVEHAGGPEAARNRLVAQIGWTAALLGVHDGAKALEHVAAAERILAAGAPAPFAGPYGRGQAVGAAAPGDYKLLLDGLRGQAHLAAGQLPEAAAAMIRRRDGLMARLEKTGLDEDRHELAAAEAQLALVASRRKQPDEALARVEAGLRQWDAWADRTGTPVDDLGLALLAAYAELHLMDGVPLARLGLDLPKRLDASYARLSKVRNPDWEPMRERLELYLVLMNLGRNR
jgi:hypothetical protein